MENGKFKSADVACKKRSLSINYGQVLGTVSYNLYYNFVYSLITSSSPLNRLLIPSEYFNLPRLPIGIYYSVKLLSHFVLSLKPNPLCTLCFYPYTSSSYLPPPFRPYFSFETFFFCAAWAFTSLSPSFDTPTRLTQKKYRIITFVPSLPLRKVSFFFLFRFYAT